MTTETALSAPFRRIVTDVDEYLALCLSHEESYEVKVLGQKLRVHPQTMSPRYSYSPTFVIRHWNIAADMEVLDVGTGSGVLAIFAGLAGAKRVVGFDINPHAVETAWKNVHLHQLLDVVTIHRSDLFEAVAGERFDRVIFNAPYFNHWADPAVPLTYGVFDADYRSTGGFLRQAAGYLKPHGRILLGFSPLGDQVRLEGLIAEADLTVQHLASETVGHTRLLYTLVPADNGEAAQTKLPFWRTDPLED